MNSRVGLKPAGQLVGPAPPYLFCTFQTTFSQVSNSSKNNLNRTAQTGIMVGRYGKIQPDGIHEYVIADFREDFDLIKVELESDKETSKRRKYGKFK